MKAGTDFPEPVKLEARKLAAFRCCFCRERMGDEVHHLVPKEQGGQGVLDNAILLCAQCHNDYGNNPLKQKQLRQARDDWYEIVERRHSKTEIERIGQLATKSDIDQIATEIQQLAGKVESGLRAGTIGSLDAANVASTMVSSLAAPSMPELDWLQLEERFRRIPGELTAFWERYESGVVEWSVYPRNGEEARNVDRFLNEARIAGRKAASLNIPGKFADATFTDIADYWVDVVAALVDPGSDITGSGVGPRGRSESGSIERLIEASQVACARLAAEVPLSKSAPVDISVRRAQINRWREMVLLIHKQTRMKKNESRSVTSLLELHPDFLTLKPLLSQQSKDAIYGRTIIVPPDQSEMSGTLHSLLQNIEDLEKSWGLRG